MSSFVLRFILLAFLSARIALLSVDPNQSLDEGEHVADLLCLFVDDREVTEVWPIDSVVDVHGVLIDRTDELA